MAEQTPEADGKKKRTEKTRKRDNLSLENVLKSLRNHDATERFQKLQEKYQQLYEEHRAQYNHLTSAEKRVTILQRERDQLTLENGKSILTRTRLESLCRELQKQNKIIKEENIAEIRKEEKLRKDAVAKFQTTLTELTNAIQENRDKNLKLRDDKVDMASKISTMCKEFESSQDELARMRKQRDLEKQMFETTISKMQCEHLVDRKEWLKNREILETNLQKSQTNIKTLEGQLEKYTGKYEEFETTISKSKDVFDGCKSEMVKMTKQSSVLKKELKTWKDHCEKNAKEVIELTSINRKHVAEIAVNERKVDQLERLCRQLQVDRTAYIKLLKGNGIEPASRVCSDVTEAVAYKDQNPSATAAQELIDSSIPLDTTRVTETVAYKDQKPTTLAVQESNDSIPLDTARTTEPIAYKDQKPPATAAQESIDSISLDTTRVTETIAYKDQKPPVTAAQESIDSIPLDTTRVTEPVAYKDQKPITLAAQESIDSIPLDSTTISTEITKKEQGLPVLNTKIADVTVNTVFEDQKPSAIAAQESIEPIQGGCQATSKPADTPSPDPSPELTTEIS